MDRLDRLAEILLGMSSADQSRLITTFARENLDRAALEYLRLRVLSLDRVLSELDDESLKRLLNALRKPRAFALRDILEPENRGRVERLLPGRPDASAETFDAKELKDQALDILLTELSFGRIAWNSPLLRLMPPPCRPKEDEPKQKGRVIMQIMNPMVAPNEGVLLLIYAPAAGRVVNISFQTRGELFFSEKKWFRPVELDLNGFFLGEVFPRREEGPMVVQAEFPGLGRVRRTCLMTRGAPAKIDLRILSKRKEAANLKLRFRLSNASADVSEARGVLWCLKCGAPAGSGTAVIQGGVGDFELNLPPTAPNHDGPMYLHVHVGERVLGQVINPPGEEPPEVPLMELNDRRPGEVIRFQPSGIQRGERLLYHASMSPAANDAAREILADGIIPLTGKSATAIPRRESPLELSLLDGDVLMLRPRRAPLRVATNTYAGNEFIYVPQDAENVSPVYLDVYRIASGGIIPVARVVSRPAKEAMVWVDAPEHLEPNEHVDLPVYYRGPGGGTLSIENGRRENFQTREAGIAQVTLRSGDKIRIALRTSGSADEIELETRSQPMNTQRLEYAPPGSELSSEDGTREIFASIDELSEFVLDRHIISYPWGCAEQTAARIGAIGLAMVARGIRDPDHPFARNIKDGLKTLRSFRSDAGDFAIFHGGEASAGNTRFIRSNLSCLAPHRDFLGDGLPALYKLIDELGGPLESRRKDPTRSELAPIISDDPEIDVLPDPACNLREKDGTLNFAFDGWMSMSSYCASLAARLMLYGETDTQVFAGTKKEALPVPAGGFRGFLERLGLVSPRLIHRKVCVGRPLKNAVPVLLKHTGFEYREFSAMSTQESTALISLLARLPKRPYKYLDARGGKFTPEKRGVPEGDIVVASPNTWVLRTFPEPVIHTHDKLSVQVDKRELSRGEITVLRIKSDTAHSEIYHLLLPAILEPVFDSSHATQRRRVSVHSGMLNREVHLRARYSGVGRLRIVAEKMYDPSAGFVFDAGEFTVSGGATSTTRNQER